MCKAKEKEGGDQPAWLFILAPYVIQGLPSEKDNILSNVYCVTCGFIKSAPNYQNSNSNQCLRLLTAASAVG